MNYHLTPQMINQIQELSAYAREKGYAEVVVTPDGHASFKRGSIAFIAKNVWRDPFMNAIRVVTILWLILITAAAWILGGISLFTPLLSLDFGLLLILFAAPWLCVIAMIGGSLFVEGVESKYLINLSFFLGVLLIGIGWMTHIDYVSVLFYIMGLPCLILAYLPDITHLFASLRRRSHPK